MMKSSELILRKIPDAIRGEAEKAGLHEAECLFCVRADLDLDGEPERRRCLRCTVGSRSHTAVAR